MKTPPERFATTSVLVLCAAVFAASQQTISNFDRRRAEDMLAMVANDVKRHYYDPKFHGVDFEGRVAEAKQQIAKSTSFNMAISHIAAALDVLNDSHTYFVPPQHAFHHSYGMQYQIIGNRCFVTQVRPGSDAESKGVKRGDEILAINGFHVDRNDLWKIQYMFSALRPAGGFAFCFAGSRWLAAAG